MGEADTTKAGDIGLGSEADVARADVGLASAEAETARAGDVGLASEADVAKAGEVGLVSEANTAKPKALARKCGRYH